MEQNISVFGHMSSGETVYSVKLRNHFLSCEIITYGATLRTLLVPDRDGKSTDIVLGYDTLEEYLTGGCYFGATVGRVANRIAGGRFELNGKSYSLPINDGNNHHHGGPFGFSHRVWDIRSVSSDSVTLSLDSCDGDQGYPGNMRVTAEYTLRENALVVHHTATTDADTLCSLTNHSYFNLSGHDTGSVLDQNILLFAHEYTPSNAEGIPFGTIEPVENTPMDLRELLPIGTHIHDHYQQLIQAGGYDHNYVVNGLSGSLRSAAMALSDLTGISMQVETTMPGIHFYTANYIRKGHTGKGGCKYGPRHGFCLETQFYPDSIHHSSFPSPVLKAGSKYDHTTIFTFTTL